MDLLCKRQQRQILHDNSDSIDASQRTLQLRGVCEHSTGLDTLSLPHDQ